MLCRMGRTLGPHRAAPSQLKILCIFSRTESPFLPIKMAFNKRNSIAKCIQKRILLPNTSEAELFEVVKISVYPNQYQKLLQESWIFRPKKARKGVTWVVL